MEKEEFNFKNYDSHEGMGAAFYLVTGISILFITTVGLIITAIIC